MMFLFVCVWLLGVRPILEKEIRFIVQFDALFKTEFFSTKEM